jgi:hypothetical protein
MAKEKKEVAPDLYQLVVRPGKDGTHELVLMDNHCRADTDRAEKHSLESLLARIRELDLDTLRARQDEKFREEQQVRFLRSFPPRAM